VPTPVSGGKGREGRNRGQVSSEGVRVPGRRGMINDQSPMADNQWTNDQSALTNERVNQESNSSFVLFQC
jgi:hypothetical protein